MFRSPWSRTDIRERRERRIDCREKVIVARLCPVPSFRFRLKCRDELFLPFSGSSLRARDVFFFSENQISLRDKLLLSFSNLFWLLSLMFRISWVCWNKSADFKTEIFGDKSFSFLVGISPALQNNGFNGTVRVISSNPRCKDGNSRFTTVLMKP